MRQLILLFFLFINTSSQAQVGMPFFIDTTFSSAGVSRFLCADINGDGNNDLVTSFKGNNGRIGHYPNLGNGNFGAFVPAGSFPFCNGAAVGYFNSDTLPDILAIGDIDNRIILFLNNAGVLQLTEVIDSLVPNILNDIVVADFDNANGDDCVVIGQHTIDFYRNDGTGSFTRETILSTSTSPFVLECLDLDVMDLENDGDMDLVCGETAGLVTYTNNGNGIFSPFYHSVQPEIVRCILAIDINNDSLTDVIVNNSAEDLKWFQNMGNGQLIAQNTILNREIKSMAVNDLNHDGMKDVFMSYQNHVAVLLNDSTHTFAIEQSVWQDNSLLMGAVATGDLDISWGPDYIWSGANKTIAVHLAVAPAAVNELSHAIRLKCYPNPTDGIVQFDQKIDKLRIFDLSGRMHLYSGSLTSIDLSALEPGYYNMIGEVGTTLFFSSVIKR